MKFAIDERVKHRLTGLVVIISIAAIFLPAMMKKSNQHFDESVSASIKLPAKPIPPKLTIQNDKALFKTIQLARVDKPIRVDVPPVSKFSKAEPISKTSTIAPVIVQQKVPVLTKKTIVQVRTKAVHPDMIKSASSALLKKDRYAVQLASFSQQSNAQVLVSRLRSQGYSANYIKILGKQGEYYKVVVGQLDAREAAVLLQKKLASSMQLHGFIVKTGVS